MSLSKSVRVQSPGSSPHPRKNPHKASVTPGYWRYICRITALPLQSAMEEKTPATPPNAAPANTTGIPAALASEPAPAVPIEAALAHEPPAKKQRGRGTAFEAADCAKKAYNKSFADWEKDLNKYNRIEEATMALPGSARPCQKVGATHGALMRAQQMKDEKPRCQLDTSKVLRAYASSLPSSTVLWIRVYPRLRCIISYDLALTQIPAKDSTLGAYN
eukprot:6193758-Pleurochrysis_carterae.AAC.2